MLTSIPTPQPQPSEAFYDISKLNLFTDFTRATYRAAAGEDGEPEPEQVAVVAALGGALGEHAHGEEHLRRRGDW